MEIYDLWSVQQTDIEQRRRLLLLLFYTFFFLNCPWGYLTPGLTINDKNKKYCCSGEPQTCPTSTQYCSAAEKDKCCQRKFVSLDSLVIKRVRRLILSMNAAPELVTGKNVSTAISTKIGRGQLCILEYLLIGSGVAGRICSERSVF